MNDPPLSKQKPPEQNPSAAELHAEFEAVLPRIRLHASLTFRDLRCPQTRDDSIAETIGLAWRWFRVLTFNGRHPMRFPTTLARRCVQAVLSGRRLTGSESVLDVLSSVFSRRRGIRVERLEQPDCLPSREASDFKDLRLGLDAWVNSLPDRERLIVELLVAGHRGDEVAEMVGLSRARVSQIRRELLNHWKRFIAQSGR